MMGLFVAGTDYTSYADTRVPLSNKRLVISARFVEGLELANEILTNRG